MGLLVLHGKGISPESSWIFQATGVLLKEDKNKCLFINLLFLTFLSPSQLVRGDSEDWQVHYSSSSKLVAKDDLAVADCCIFLKIERIISTGIGTGSRYMFQ